MPCSGLRQYVFRLVGERKFSPKFFRPKFFRGHPHGVSVPKCFIFQDLERLTEVFGGMSAGISGRKLPLWADFSFLISAGLHLGEIPAGFGIFRVVIYELSNQLCPFICAIVYHHTRVGS